MSDKYWGAGDITMGGKGAKDLDWLVKPNAPEDRAKAARAVASRSQNAAECALLLSMLGLSASEGLSAAEAA